MKTTVATFVSPKDVLAAIEQLRNLEFKDEEISILTPHASKRDIEDVPTTETEQPGVGKAIGGVVGGAVGVAGGALVGSAVSMLLFPALGPVLVSGFITTLGGIGGGVGGAAAADSLEKRLSTGLPKDELLFYENALRKGRTVVILVSEEHSKIDSACELLNEAGAESVDAARGKWWIGLRDARATQ